LTRPSGSDEIERFRLADVLPEPISHYTDAVRAGDTLWVSGLLGTDRTGTIVGGTDPAAQTEQILANLMRVLERAGATFADVAKVVVYLRHMGDRETVDEVRKRYFGESRPASTLVEVQALAHPSALVEIEAVVHVPRSPARDKRRSLRRSVRARAS
jgi:2-iminobutanoate/2-iminopropanoate deaminase